MRRIYGILLRLLPREYDAVDRAEMRRTYEDRVARARASGGAAAGWWKSLRETADLARTLFVHAGPAGFLESMVGDVRLGLRSLRRTPLASGLAVVCLALGIGATTAIFSSLDVWLIRPLPLPNADRLVAVGMANRAEGWMNNVFSVRDWIDWRGESETVDLAVYRRGSSNLATSDRATRVETIETSVNLLHVLGFTPRVGRFFDESEGRVGAPRVVVLSHAFWRSVLGGSEAAVGEDVVLDGVPHTVIGVLPEGAGIPGIPSDIWSPLRVSGDEPRAGHSLFGVGLLRDDVTLEAASDELNAVASRVARLDPDGTFPDARVRPFRKAIYGREFEQGGLVLAGAVLFVLLIACANIANLLLARGFSRTHEMAVRGALGADRNRIVRQLLTESTVIALFGGLLGIGVGYVGVDLLLTYVLPPEAVPGWSEISLNERALAFAAVLTVLSVFVFGLVPALRSSRVDLAERLTEGDRAGIGSRRHRLASALVVGEISAALALLVLSGLLVRDVAEMHSLDLRMRTQDALVFRLLVPTSSRETLAGATAFHEEVARRIAERPGVTGVGVSTGIPVGGWSTTLYSVPGLDSRDGEPRLSAESRRVTAAYADVMELDLVAGRWFDEGTDRAGSPAVAVVSTELADRWWDRPTEALGQALRFRENERTIVGVVDAGHLRGPEADPPPVIFEPFAQAPSRYAFFVAAHSGDAEPIAAEIREIVRSLDPGIAVFELQTLEEMIDGRLGGHVAALRIFAALGLLAFTLTVVGVYGVMAHTVGQRMREMGLRMALGARPVRVLGLVLGRTVRIALVGLVLGLALSAAGGHALAFLLVDVSPTDPVVLSATAASILAAVLAAAYLPARKAAAADPVETLRVD